MTRFRLDYLSPHVSYRDATFSPTAIRHGIDNAPGLPELKAMKAVAVEVYERLWIMSGGKIRINSFYRGSALNAAVKGSKTSQHMRGEAIDIDAVAPLTNKQLLAIARKLPVYDQLINEYPDASGNPSWVHVSFTATGTNRRMELTIP